jgi:hypothetical protein
LIGDFLSLALHQIERGIGETDRTVGTDDDVVGAVELLAFEVVGEDGVLTVWSDSNDGAQDARGVDQTELTVVGVAVGIAECEQLFFVAVGVDAKNFVDLFVANIDETGFVPDRTFGETKAGGNGFELRLFRDELPESWRVRFKFELSWRLVLRPDDGGIQQRRQNGDDEQRHGSR